MSNTLSVRLVCFSLVKQALGESEVTLDLPMGSTGTDLEERVRQIAAGQLGGVPLRLAVNKEFVPAETELHDGDEVCLIPPVQGG